MSVLNEKNDDGDFLGMAALRHIIECALVLKSFILSDRFFTEFLTPTQSAIN